MAKVKIVKRDELAQQLSGADEAVDSENMSDVSNDDTETNQLEDVIDKLYVLHDMLFDAVDERDWSMVKAAIRDLERILDM